MRQYQVCPAWFTPWWIFCGWWIPLHWVRGFGTWNLEDGFIVIRHRCSYGLVIIFDHRLWFRNFTLHTREQLRSTPSRLVVNHWQCCMLMVKWHGCYRKYIISLDCRLKARRPCCYPKHKQLVWQVPALVQVALVLLVELAWLVPWSLLCFCWHLLVF